MIRLGKFAIKPDLRADQAQVVIDGVVLARHAIDRAFERCHRHFEETKLTDEGALKWLARQVREALAKGERDKQGVFIHNGLGLAIDVDDQLPTLKTIYVAGCYRSSESAVTVLREKLLSIAAVRGNAEK